MKQLCHIPHATCPSVHAVIDASDWVAFGAYRTCVFRTTFCVLPLFPTLHTLINSHMPL